MMMTGENGSAEGRTCSRGHLVRQKSHMDDTGIESGPLRLEAGN